MAYFPIRNRKHGIWAITSRFLRPELKARKKEEKMPTRMMFSQVVIKETNIV
jgi:hypothetical protein